MVSSFGISVYEFRDCWPDSLKASADRPLASGFFQRFCLILSSKAFHLNTGWQYGGVEPSNSSFDSAWGISPRLGVTATVVGYFVSSAPWSPISLSVSKLYSRLYGRKQVPGIKESRYSTLAWSRCRGTHDPRIIAQIRSKYQRSIAFFSSCQRVP